MIYLGFYGAVRPTSAGSEEVFTGFEGKRLANADNILCEINRLLNADNILCEITRLFNADNILFHG